MALRRVVWLFTLIALFPTVLAAQQARTPARITQPIDETNLTVLRGNTHPLARPEFDRGPAPSNLPLNRMLLVLQRSPDQEATLKTLLDQQQDKSSANFHQWLTPEQFGQQFGPADEDVQAVTAWLSSHGFQVNRVAKGRTTLEFSGTAAQLRDAFHTEIHKYSVNGEDHWANASDPQIPSALAPVIAGIHSLNSFPRRPLLHIDGAFSKSKATGKVTPVKPLLTISKGGCGVSGNCYALGPFDFATIYNLLPLWNASTAIDGTGQAIAIVAETDINPQDVSEFRSFWGMAAPSLNVIHDGPDPGILTDGEEGESDLDVEWSGAVAKGATIDLVVSAATETTHGVDLSAEYIVDNNLAPVMSESYGECELGIGTTGNQFFSQLWQQAAAQGITVFVAAGDAGSSDCDNFGAKTRPAPAQFGLEVSGYASTPYNVAVGATDFNDAMTTTLYWNSTNAPTTQLSALGYIPETTWNDTCTNGIFASLGYSSNAESNCNNANLVDFVATIGGGGGKSSCTTPSSNTSSSCSGGYGKPSWQTGPGVPADNKRDIPDVSLFAASGSPSGSFYIVCEADAVQGSSCDPTNASTEFLGVGGTSASSPIFAGLMALINQKTGERQGNANYVFYKIPTQSGASCNSTDVASKTANSCIFYDTTNGTNAMPCASGSDPTCVVKTAGDQVGVLSGYSTTAGYDLATGLGSVNASNLVNQWSTFAGQFKGTNTALTLTPPSGFTLSTLTHGQTVQIASTVSGSGGTPSGSVALMANEGTNGAAGASDGVQAFSLNSAGVASGATTSLPGGSYTVFAQYGGDGTFASSSSSPPIAVTVAPEASKVAVAYETFSPTTGLLTNPNATTAIVGTRAILRVNVTSAAADACPDNGSGESGCPTGTVTLTDSYNGGPAGTLNSTGFALNPQGYTEDQAICLAGGSHIIAATYSGDNSFTPPVSPATDSLSITPAATATSITATPTSSTVGSTVYLAASITAQNISCSIIPTGMVAFYFGTTQIATAGGGDVIFGPTGMTFVTSTNTNALPQGHDSITGQYTGDPSYASSTSAPITVSVLYPTTAAISSSNSSIQANQSVTFTANISPSQSGGPALTGTAQFQVNGGNIGNPVALQNGQAQFTTSALPSGSDNISAVYSGDTNYAGSSASLTETVAPGPTFSVTESPASIGIGSPGQSTSTMLMFAAQNGFTGSTTLSGALCSGLPSESTCSFSPSMVNLTAQTTSQTVTLTINTTAPSSAVPSSQRLTPGNWQTPAQLVMLSALCLGLALRMYRAPHRRATAILALALLATITAAISCGGGGSGGSGGGGNPGTPMGNYTVTVTFTIGGVTQSTNVALSVQ